MDSIGCHLSSPFLADIEKKDGIKLVLHRFVIPSPYANPWNCILMAIDKSRGYLVYSFVHEGFRHAQDCWFISAEVPELDVLRNVLHGKDNGMFHLQDYTFTPLLCDKRLRPDEKPIWLHPEDEKSCFPDVYLPQLFPFSLHNKYIRVMVDMNQIVLNY
ncbi:hypothetical protein LIER_41375 [Lithospermum erythrorhizon]|uniref:Uncharacterized protein n=1 Tax=Lithospermum erythrorhizon TaxID=34254 RepID=A0AAV3R8C8_LITER